MTLRELQELVNEEARSLDDIADGVQVSFEPESDSHTDDLDMDRELSQRNIRAFSNGLHYITSVSLEGGNDYDENHRSAIVLTFYLNRNEVEE